MAGPSAVGPRFSIPHISNLSRTFIELRRVGVYPRDLVFAIVFGYFETRFDLDEDFSSELMMGLLQNQDFSRYYYDLLTQRTQTGFLDDQEVQTVIRKIADSASEGNNLQCYNEYAVIQSVDMLRILLKMNVRVYISPGEFPNLTQGGVLVPDDPKSDKQKLTVCVCNPQSDGRIFLVYPYMSESSFVRLRCSHYTFKKLIYKQLAIPGLSNSALSSGDIGTMQLSCKTCSAPYFLNDVQWSEFGLMLNGYDQHRLFKQCNHRRDPLATLKCMRCDSGFCADCAILGSLLAKGPTCGNCKTSYADQLDRAIGRDHYEWVKPYLTIVISEWKYQRPDRECCFNEQSPIHSRDSSTISLIQINEEVKTNPRHSTSSETPKGCCKNCKEILHESPCKTKDICISCYYKYSFANKDNDTCPYCLKKFTKKLGLREDKCAVCLNKDYIIDLFHWCNQCRKGVCCKCVKSNPELYEICPNAKEKHTVHSSKINEILGEKSTAFRS